ncbi:MAG: response regulator [bacterium]|nr:response regulator [bacterium]
MNAMTDEQDNGLIFIADDIPKNLQVLANILTQAKYNISFAVDGEQALQLIRAGNPDLVLLDVMMPKMNGFEVCIELQKEPETRDIPIIFLTAKVELDDIVEGFRVGGVDYVTKPFQTEELLARVRTQIDLKRSKDKILRINRQLEKELGGAAAYVHSLLPPALGEGDKPHTDWRFIPSMQLGGDIFNYRWVDNDHFAFYLLDVCGHGVETALLSVSIMNLLNSEIMSDTNYSNPAEVLKRVNEKFLLNNPNYMFFTIWYGVYKRSEHKLIYSCGGHPPSILVSGKNAHEAEVLKLKTPGLVVGAMSEAAYVNREQPLEDFNTLFLFSDGGYEINKKSDGQMWTFDEWSRLLVDSVRTKNGDLDWVIRYVQELGGTKQLDDDFSILKLEF